MINICSVQESSSVLRMSATSKDDNKTKNKKRTDRMKASFRDKYIEICENTMHHPDDMYLVKGTLLSHLKLNVCPVIGSGMEEDDNLITRHQQERIEQENAGKTKTTIPSKDSLKKKNSSTSPLQRKKCFRRNSDQRSRAEKARGIDVYERKIATTSNTANSSNFANTSTTSARDSLHLATSDGCFIPEEIKQQILKARYDCMMAKRRSEGSLNSKHNSSYRDENSNELGTFINVSYRNSRRELIVDQKGPVHSYVPHPPPPLRRSHLDLHRMSSDGRDVTDSHEDAYNSSSTESDYDEVENPYSFVANTTENPYSTVFPDNDLRRSNRKKKEKDGAASPPIYYALEDVCEKHGLDTLDCTECGNISEPIYSEPSISSTGSGSDNNNDSSKPICFESSTGGGMLPEQYLTKTSISQQNSNTSTSSCVSFDGEGDAAMSEPFYHVLEDIVPSSQTSDDAHRRSKSALSNIREDSEEVVEHEEIFV